LHRGHEIDTQGDAFFVAFASARDAVLAAIAGQRKLAEHEWPDGAPVKVRIGIHTGQASPALVRELPDRDDFIVGTLSCGSDGNFGHFCDRRLDRTMDRALKVQQRDPAAANRLWADLDRELTDRAAWVALYNRYGADLVSKRVGNYQYNPQWGALLSQMWVR
jgi:ABC-type transport system substrate-binding protein